MSLAGKHIVVTRPAHQAGQLASMIAAAGANVILFPVIDIAPADDSAELDEVLSHLSEFDLAIFISANAVKFGLARIQPAGVLPPGLQIAAVGDATRQALVKAGVNVNIFPQDSFNSEALLALDAMQQVSGKHIVIFRGDGGRELLADTLRQRQANVVYAEVYKRTRPQIDSSALVTCLKNHQVDAIIVTSDQGLKHLWEMVGPAAQSELAMTQLVVMSARTSQLARQMGFSKTPVISHRAGDNELLEALDSCA